MSESIHFTCPSCAGVNRVLTDRIRHSPSCGRCGSALFETNTVDLEDATFDHFLTRNDLPVVVDFWSSLCGPCQMMAPAYNQAAATLKERVRFAKLLTDANQQTASKYQVTSVPTLVIYKQGKETERISGALAANDIANWVRQHTQ